MTILQIIGVIQITLWFIIIFMTGYAKFKCQKDIVDYRIFIFTCIALMLYIIRVDFF